MGLRTRLALAGVALIVPADRADPEVLAPLVDAGVDMLILGASGKLHEDVETLSAMRGRWAGRPLLIGTAGARVAAPAAADVVHLRRPGWRFWGYPQGHEWSLLGRHALEESVVESPGDDFDYLFVPLSGTGDPLLESAIAHQPPLTAGALPWFALCTHGQDEVEALLAAGARRIALAADILDRDDAADRVSAIATSVEGVWRDDPQARSYRMGAFHL